MANSMTEKSKQVKYIIHHASIGLGDILITLCAACDYAAQYRVPLIIDWRNSRWLAHKRKNARAPGEMPNLFEIIFGNRNTLGGIDIITDSRRIDEILPNKKLKEIRPRSAFALSGEIKKKYMDGSEEILPRKYNVQISHANNVLIRALQISAPYASKAADWLEKNRNKDMVGVHIRIGNGEFQEIEKVDMPKLMAKAVADAHKIIKSMGCIDNEKYCLYITSDTPHAADYVRREFKKYEIVDYFGTRPPFGTTASLLFVNSDTSADEAEALLETTVVEMLILSKAKYLISIHSRRWISGFTYYARNFIPCENCHFITRFRFGRLAFHFSGKESRDNGFRLGAPRGLGEHGRLLGRKLTALIGSWIDLLHC